MKQSFEFKGIVRGSYSMYQAVGYNEMPTHSFKGASLVEVLDDLILNEWVFFLKVNGKRIKNAFEYIQRKGLDLNDYARKENFETEGSHD